MKRSTASAGDLPFSPVGVEDSWRLYLESSHSHRLLPLVQRPAPPGLREVDHDHVLLRHREAEGAVGASVPEGERIEPEDLPVVAVPAVLVAAPGNQRTRDRLLGQEPAAALEPRPVDPRGQPARVVEGARQEAPDARKYGNTSSPSAGVQYCVQRPSSSRM